MRKIFTSQLHTSLRIFLTDLIVLVEERGWTEDCSVSEAFTDLRIDIVSIEHDEGVLNGS